MEIAVGERECGNVVIACRLLANGIVVGVFGVVEGGGGDVSEGRGVVGGRGGSGGD